MKNIIVTEKYESQEMRNNIISVGACLDPGVRSVKEWQECSYSSRWAYLFGSSR